MIANRKKKNSKIHRPWDKVNAMGFDRLPAGLLDGRCCLGELVGGQLACPVGLNGLLCLAIATDARESKNGRCNHD